MGCAISKQKVCENCHVPLSQRVPRRSKSMHVHHKGDSYHLVSLTSSTLGSLRLDPLHTNHYIDEALASSGNVVGKVVEKKGKEDFALVEGKTWSKWLEEKMPKGIPNIPVQTVAAEPETINAWELMEGLEDDSPLTHLDDHPRDDLRSVSYYNVQSSTENVVDTKSMVLEVAGRDNESQLHSDTGSVVPEFDPEVISTFRKSLEELPPVSPFHLKPLISETDVELEVTDVKKMNGVDKDYKFVTLANEKLVLYFTSLRGVRKTYEDCCHVRVILKGLGVKIDEKDVSMHSGFKEELKELLGEGYPGGGLPKLFIGTKLVGGAEEIRRMNEAGQLEKLVERCEKLDKCSTIGGRYGSVCEACGDIRFTPCDTCSGSCKIFCEGDFDEENEEDGYGFQRCPNCNENGLIRCRVCCN